MRFKAVLWDCDGVLIDSEVISCGANAAFMTKCGYPVTLEKFLTNYMGKGRRQILADILAESGIDLTPHYADGSFNEHQKELFRQQVTAIPGVADVLAHLNVPVAVASGSEKARLDLTLGVAGLTPFFDGHIYSAEFVAKGKPAPDIFLYAAEKLGVAPADCLVIEDGIHGIHAAQAAGMEVWAFLGGSHIFPALREQILATKPDCVFDDMRDISGALMAEKLAV
jgi:HAD superfamily hydrolase (TIGR01509 family)